MKKLIQIMSLLTKMKLLNSLSNGSIIKKKERKDQNKCQPKNYKKLNPKEKEKKKLPEKVIFILDIIGWGAYLIYIY